jgi:hypothetical protein
MMKQGFYDEHWCDSNDNPAGGVSTGTGFTISWQNGPLGRGGNRRAPNGAFVEDVIQAVRQRIEFYQTARDGTFACQENEEAIEALKMAEAVLDKRIRDREARQVEGMHTA